jgi:hypothetical protein
VFTERLDTIVSDTLYPTVCAVADCPALLFEAFVKSNRLALMWANRPRRPRPSSCMLESVFEIRALPLPSPARGHGHGAGPAVLCVTDDD